MPSLTQEQKNIMKDIIKTMNDADRIQEAMRRKDPKAIHHIYDRNAYYRCASSGLMYNKPIGNCEDESLQRFYEMNDQRAQVRFSYERDHVFRGVTRSDYHVGIVYFDGDEWRFETYANGIHEDERFTDMFSDRYNLTQIGIHETNLPKEIQKGFSKYVTKLVDESHRRKMCKKDVVARNNDEAFKHFMSLKVGDSFELVKEYPAPNGKEKMVQKLKIDNVTEKLKETLCRETFDNLMNLMEISKEKAFEKHYTNKYDPQRGNEERSND